MIRQISDHFDTKLSLTGWIEKFYPLVKMVEDIPQYYVGNSQYVPVSNFDNWNGMAYIRLVNNPTISENTDQSNRACSEAMNVTYSFRFVFAIKRTALKIDDAFAEDRLIGDLIKSLSVKNGSLRTNLSAMSAYIVPESWTTEASEVTAQEYPGKDVSINAEFIYGAINFNALILINKDCITDSCEDPCYAYAG